MMTVTGLRQRLGWWRGQAAPPSVDDAALEAALHAVARPVYVLDVDGQLGVAQDGIGTIADNHEDGLAGFPLLGFAPALTPEHFGDSEFRATHGVRYAYIGGAMAHGIASETMVEAFGRAGMIGFFGAAGLGLDRIDMAIQRLQHSLGDTPYGFNLIHSPQEPRHEAATVDLYLKRGIHRVSAAAYIELTEPLIRYRVTGLHKDSAGRIVAPNRVLGTISRVEVARRFFSPPPEGIVATLLSKNLITKEEFELARRIPVAEDLTAEADSGGHTDNRPAITLLPTMMALRDQIQDEYGYATRLRVGAAGGIATPASAAAAFAMGAAYVVTGTVNQACVESGTSAAVRKMLAEAGQADVTMAPAADMFEMGVNVQVLKRGTMFAMRARKLYELYRAYNSLDEIPAAQRAALERDFFHASLEQAWQQTRGFFEQRDPSQNERAGRDPKHKMALIFRAYLGQASHWAVAGDPARQMDYQVWCGPAMGAFNEWANGSFLEQPDNRDVVTVALNLLVGAAALTRAAWLRAQGVPLPSRAMRFAPRTREEIAGLLQG
jgi:trans-AT polyketide synthase, acyltransferase and oxidoreductase domains